MTDQKSITDRTYRGHLDIACEHLADDLEAERFEHRETRADRDSYRELLQLALAALADLTRERNRGSERIRLLLEELRALRASLQGEAA